MSNVEKEWPVKEAADRLYNAMDELNDELPHNVTAPTVYSITGNLKLAAGSSLQAFLYRMAEGLSRSLIDFDNYAAEGDETPAEAIAAAIAHIRSAAVLAGNIGQELIDAQVAIRNIGYREPGDIGYRKPEDRT